MRTRSTRIRLAAITAATLALVAFAPTPAFADTSVTFQLMFATTDFLSSEQPIRTGQLDIFDAAGDGTVALFSEPFTTEGAPSGNLGSASVSVTLPDGQYRVRASAEGLQPAWFGGPATDEQFGYDTFYGFNATSALANSSVVTVDSGAPTDATRYIMLHPSARTIGGVVFAQNSTTTVSLYAVGGAAPVMTQTVSGDLPVYAFQNVPVGSFLMKFTAVRGPESENPGQVVEQWWPFAGSRSQAEPLALTADGGHWVALDANLESDLTGDGDVVASIGGTPIVGGSLQLNVQSTVFDLDIKQSDTFLRSIQWLADGTPIAGALSRTLVVPAAAQGKVITATAEYYGFLGYLHQNVTWPGTSPVAPSALPQISPAGTPTIDGTPTIGTALTTTIGTWAAGVSKTFQWNRNGIPIPGATARNYKPVGEDAGSTLTFTVTGTKAGFATTTQTSLPTAPVAAALTLVRTSVPQIQGGLNPKVGKALTVGEGTWRPQPVEFAYQWFRGGAAILGATAETYVPTADDVGALLTVALTGSKLGYPSDTQVSPPSAAVSEGAISWVKPVVTGTPVVGSTLSTDASTWGPIGIALSYQWTWSDGTVIAGANGSSYSPVLVDRNKKLVVTVTATLPGYTSQVRSSAATAKVT